MSVLRIAVVGAGGIAQRYHLPSLRRLEDEGAGIELAALCDIDADKAREMGTRFGFRETYTDYREMIDTAAPDAVWVLVPIPATRQVAGYMLSRGVPTLMEKPPGAHSRETQELIEIAASNNTPNQVAFNRRHAPTLVRMKALLVEAGQFWAASCQFYRFHRGEAEFAFGTGLHGLDALRFLGDSEVREVHTRAGPRTSAVVTLVYESGALGTMEMLPEVGIQSERYTAHAGERTVCVDGVVGWLTRFPGFLRCYDGTELTHTVDNADDPGPPELVSGFYGESASFVNCLREGTRGLREGRRPYPDLASSLRSVQIAEAVQRGVSQVFGAGQGLT